MVNAAVAVRLFARFRDAAGVDAVAITLPQPATVADLRRHLGERFPALGGLLARSALAVNGEFADDDIPVSADDEVALIPPVSGG